MSEPTPIRTLLCFSMQPAFFDLPFGAIGPVWQATQALMSGIAKLPGVAIVGTLDDDQTMVGMSNGTPATWYILADFPDRQAVIAACNLLRSIVVDDADHRLWKFMRVEARMGRALTIPEL